jgi:transposase InsO family protein
VYGKPRAIKRAPASHWIRPEEKEAIITFKHLHMTTGYRRLSWMMVDRDIALVSPTSVLRVLTEADLNNRWTRLAGKAHRTGFTQPLRVHEQWHTDISYVNMRGTFVFLIAVLDGFSRAILAWDIRERMECFDVDMVVRMAYEKWIAGTAERPRLITDNGAQFVAAEFKQSLRDQGIEHSRTRVAHPQSNGKIERFHGTAKQEQLRVTPALSLKQMKSEFGKWIDYYNSERLHSAIGYVAPFDVIRGRRDEIIRAREEKLSLAKKERSRKNRQNQDEKIRTGAA